MLLVNKAVASTRRRLVSQLSVGLRRAFHKTLDHRQAVLTIKAEHPSRLWERRTPLVPDDVGRLLSKFGRDQLTVQVESSQKRIFDDRSFAEAGAQIVGPGDGDGDIVIAIKEIPIQQLHNRNDRQEPRTYCFFSHTHKGQAYNLPLLKQMVACGDRFVDWELLVDLETKSRQVSFGRLAGVVGAGEALSGYGLLALKQGFSTLFLNLPRPYTFDSGDDFFKALDQLQSRINHEGYRGPLVSVVVTGSTGRVGKGVVEVLDRAGIQWIDNLDEMKYQLDSTDGLHKHHKIIGHKLSLPDYLVNQTGQAFDRSQYNQHPDHFASVFHENVAPLTTLLINGAYWTPGVPRFLSNQQLGSLISRPNHRLRGITDISCDFHGALEFVERATTIEAPYAYFKPTQDKGGLVEAPWTDPKASLQLISIEILPSELAKDASIVFSSSISPYICALITTKLKGDSSTFQTYIDQLNNATICGDKRLMPQHQHLHTLLTGSSTSGNSLDKNSIPESPLKVEIGAAVRKVVIFGSGLVAKPTVETLLSDRTTSVVIGTNMPEEAETVKSEICAQNSADRARIQVVKLDAVSDKDAVNDLVKRADVVLSLLPARMHPLIAIPCLDHSVNLVTASYVSPEMAKLDEIARSKGLTFLNELGLDPGIDHMTAVRLIERLKRDEPYWKIKSFVSFCGGLPEQQDEILGYRFSWSPRGVLEATGNPARFRLFGKEFEIKGEELLKKRFTRVGEGMFPQPSGRGRYQLARAKGNYALEGLANRDSLGYLARYGLSDEDLVTMMRGTLRYEGFCEVMDELRKLGLIRKTGTFEWRGSKAPKRWAEVIERMGGQVQGGRVKQVLQKLGLLPGLKLDDMPDFPSEKMLQNMIPIDLLCKLLSHKLAYGPNERDLVLLTHEIRQENKYGNQRWIKSELVVRGDQHSSAMARTVGSPVAIGALTLLDHSEGMPRGVVRPVEREVWNTVLDRVESECGFKMNEVELEQWQIDRRYGGGLEHILASGIKNW